jgi:hypothetical protein
MIPEKTNRTLLWLNFILLIIICSAIITFLTMGKSDTSSSGETGVVNSMDLLKKELNLSEEQYQKVIIQNDHTFRTYNLVLDMMCETNVALLEELGKPESDPMVLDSLARKYGLLSTSLRRHTVDYFVNIKNLCTPEQKKKLTLIFKGMMEMDKQCETCNKKDCPRKERLNNIGKN